MSNPDDACPKCGTIVTDHGGRGALQGQRMAAHDVCPKCESKLIRFEDDAGRVGAWTIDERPDDEDGE